MPHLYEIVDAQFQYLHVEGLDNVVVGPHAKTFELVFFVGFGGKQDNRDVRVSDVGLDGFAQFHSVHFGHHHIAHHQVNVFFFEHAQCLPAVGSLEYVIQFSQAFGQEV